MNKRTISLLLIAVMILFVGIAAVSATDVSNNGTNVVTDSQTTNIETSSSVTNTTAPNTSIQENTLNKIQTNNQVAGNEVNNNIKSINKKTVFTTNNLKTSDSLNTKDNTINTACNKVQTVEPTNITVKTIKTLTNKASQTYILTNNTYSSYFTSEGLLSDNVSEGDTLDLQDTIDLSTKGNIVINKPINFTSSTHNGTIISSTNEVPSFTINANGSYSNVSYITIYNTQVYIKNAKYVTFDHNNVSVSNKVVGDTVGVTSVRDNSSYITITNNYFSTDNNGGHSTLVLAWATNCLVRNNTIVGKNTCGNLLYLTTYNVNNLPNSTYINNNNILDSNNITGPTTPLGICYAIGIEGANNTISNNYVDYVGSDITAQYGQGTSTGTIIFGNVISKGSNSLLPNSKVYNNTISLAIATAGCTIYNNTFDTLTTKDNNNVYENVIGILTTAGANVNITSNIINSTIISQSNIILSTNTFKGQVLIKGSIKTPIENITVIQNEFKDINSVVPLVLNDYMTSVDIISNEIITGNEYAINTASASNVTVKYNYLVTSTNYGNNAVENDSETSNLVVEENIPNIPKGALILNNNTYGTIFDQSTGYINLTNVPSGSSIYIINDANASQFGNTTNAKILYINEPVSIISVDEGNIVYNNFTFAFVNGSEGSNLTGLVINNTNSLEEAILINNTNNITIKDVTIYNTNDNITHGLHVESSDNNTIEGNTIVVNGPSTTITYDDMLWGIPNTMGIYIYNASYNKINNNDIETTETTTNGSKPTIQGIGIYGRYGYDPTTYDIITISSVGNMISNTTVNTQGTGYVYGITASQSVDNTSLISNQINTISNGYANGIQLLGPINNAIISDNSVYTKANNLSYGIYVSTNNIGAINNVLIRNNNVLGYANTVYLVELYQGNENVATNNTLYGQGNYIIGIGTYQLSDSNITNNIINTKGNSSVGKITGDVITPNNTGISLVKTTNTIIYNNTLRVTDSANFLNNTITIDPNSKNNTITYNYLISDNKFGDSSVDNTNNTVLNNLPVTTVGTTIILSNITTVANKESIITAEIVDEKNIPVSRGIVDYYLDGKYLISTNINEGISSFVTILNGGNHTIKAVFNGTNVYKNSTAIATATIIKLNTTISVTPVTGKIGYTTVLTATIKDQYNNKVTVGKVVFKINGQTLKDLNGNVIYVNVSKGVAKLNYTLPYSWARDNVTISAVYGATTNYNGARSDLEPVNITKRTAYVSVVNNTTIKAGNTINLIATIHDSNGSIISNGKVVFKFQGKTIKDTTGKGIIVNVTDGVAKLAYTIPDGTSAKDYNITAVFGNNYYNRADGIGLITILKTNTILTTTPVTGVRGSTVKISGKIYDEKVKLIVGKIKVSIKINGITYKTLTVINGTLNTNFIIPSTLKNSKYNLTIVAGENNAYYGSTITTTLTLTKNSTKTQTVKA